MSTDINRIKKRIELIDTEINLWRTPWQSPDTPEGERSLIFQRVLSLCELRRELVNKLGG